MRFIVIALALAGCISEELDSTEQAAVASSVEGSNQPTGGDPNQPGGAPNQPPGEMDLGQTCIVGSPLPGESCKPGLVCIADNPNTRVGLCQRITRGSGSSEPAP